LAGALALLRDNWSEWKWVAVMVDESAEKSVDDSGFLMAGLSGYQ
jgi:hypothetical protein